MAETAPPINPYAPPAGAHNVPEYSVSDIAGAVKRMVEERFGRVRVRGEITGFKVHSASGHAYFRLKDENAVLDAVCWRGSIGKLPFKPEDGLEVVATGKISSYPGKSSYQIVVDFMEPAGAGALMALLEKRRAQLAAEGLFDPARKKPLPFLPQVIGVITSPTGAVIRDILHRIQERFPLHVIVWPVAVQGEGAAQQVAAAIAGFNALPAGGAVPRPDVLIVARGGGSLEDLWAFNEEVAVRAAAASAIPLISAVGHETDTTLIDFAADRRAPTPTAAAEIAVPVREYLDTLLSELLSRLKASNSRGFAARQELLAGLARGLPRPASLLEHASQRLDDWCERLTGGMRTLLSLHERRLAEWQRAFRTPAFRRQVDERERRLAEWSERLHTAAPRLLERPAQRLDGIGKLLATLNYKSVLARGYALVTTADGTLVSHATDAATRPELNVQFHDGTVRVKPT